MDPPTPQTRRSRADSRPRPLKTRETSSSNEVPRRSKTPNTPRTKSGDLFVSTPSTVQSDSTFEDDFPFDSSGEWSTGVDKNSKTTAHKKNCSPLMSPQQPDDSRTPRRPRRRMSTRTDHSNETNESNDSARRSPRRRPRRASSAVKLEQEFLVLSPTTPIAIPETPRRARRSSSIEPRRRRTASIERRRTGDLPPRRRLSMTKIGSASISTPEVLESPAARRLARHAQSVQLLTGEKPRLQRHKSADELIVPREWLEPPKRSFQ